MHNKLREKGKGIMSMKEETKSCLGEQKTVHLATTDAEMQDEADAANVSN